MRAIFKVVVDVGRAPTECAFSKARSLSFGRRGDGVHLEFGFLVVVSTLPTRFCKEDWEQRPAVGGTSMDFSGTLQLVVWQSCMPSRSTAVSRLTAVLHHSCAFLRLVYLGKPRASGSADVAKNG